MASQNIGTESSRKGLSDSIKRLETLLAEKKGGIFFKLQDIAFFCGLNYFYSQKYDRAIKYFNMSLEMKKDFIHEKEKKR